VKEHSRFAIAVSTTGVVLFLAASHAALCLSARAWVSVSGNDGNDCSRSTPCRTLTGALAKTSSGGEIDVLDSGDFGAVTLDRAVSVVTPGVLGGLQATSSAAITVNAGAADRIVLRGLTIDGLGTAQDGIVFVAGGSLYVENCTINNFARYGIEFAPTSGSGKLFVTDTIVRNTGVGSIGGGVHMISTVAPGFIASLDGLRTENNTFGLKAETWGVVTVRNSLSANNAFSGMTAVTPLGTGDVRLFVENSVSTNNLYGVISSGTSVAIISNMAITSNTTGLGISNGGLIQSFGNNKIYANGTNGAPTATVPQI
jgi:hypothetical protein